MQLGTINPPNVPPVVAPPGVSDTRPVVARLGGQLALSAPDATGRMHVSAASGLAAAGGKAWVVSDEYGELARFDRLDRPGTLHPGLPPAKKKPDLEALLAVPQADGGALLVGFGSGSSAKGTRSSALVQVVDDAGALVGGPLRSDLAPLHAELGRRLPKGLNVEGVALRGDELLVFHRGRLEGETNAIFRLDAARAIDALRTGQPLGADLVLGAHAIDLGTLAGERIGFADATVLDDGRIAFVASAEADDGDGADGPIKGSVIGVMDAAFAVQSLRPLTGPARKVEGMVATRSLDPTASATSFTLVTDPDAPKQAAEVVTVDLG